ncbi:MAG: YqaJ viral recombinase family protein [Comamonas sp.]|nr:YqaJ viral recombinase family protein [Comamonas sp.]
MSMQIVSLVQGSAEWLAHRSKHFNASDAPAMMGCSSYKSRSDLIKELATGITPDVDAATQRRFDAGHQFEALARPLAEEIIGEDLSPCVGVNGVWSASFDGLTFMHDVGFEHKSLNNTLREAMHEGCTGESLPIEYQIQMEHQAMVATSIEKILFVASKWEGEQLMEERHCWYYPNLELRAKIAAGWLQINKDSEAYDPAAERPAAAMAAPVESLPAVVIQVNGALAIGGNLDAFGDALRGFIAKMVPSPSTDQEFADAEAECKALKKAEDALDAGEDAALASISVVEQMRRLKADLKNLARTTRLAREKLVAAKKDSLRTGLVTGAQSALDRHIQTLNQSLGANWLPRVAGGFGEVIKGKKSLANMEDAVAVALTSAKHDMTVLAERLETNRKHLMQSDGDWIALFADFATVGAKAEEDFEALAALRIGNHKQAEAQRLEAQREQIRKEEAARLEREAAAKAKAEAEEAERQRQAAEVQAAQQAKAVIDAAAAPAAKAKCDGNHGGNACGDIECWQLPAPAKVLSVIEQQFEGSLCAQQARAAPKADAKVEGEILKLGQVNTMLKNAGLGQISAETLETNGITFTKERGAVLVLTSDVHRLLIKVAMGMRKLADELVISA